DDMLVGRHLLVQGLRDGLNQRQLLAAGIGAVIVLSRHGGHLGGTGGHHCPSAACSARTRSRCSRRCHGMSANTSSNIQSAGGASPASTRWAVSARYCVVRSYSAVSRCASHSLRLSSQARMRGNGSRAFQASTSSRERLYESSSE